jgi:hypothetical protein
VPRVGEVDDEITCNKVDFPDPLEPRMAVVDRGDISQLKLANIQSELNCLPKLSNVIFTIIIPVKSFRLLPVALFIKLKQF